jgi:3-oxoacyl-[acyl-carrier protein] reductase
MSPAAGLKHPARPQPPDLEKRLSGKKILITGGSSRLGMAFIRKALAEGAQVYFTYHRHGEDVQPLVEQGAEGFALDLTDMRAIEQFAKQLKEKISGLDVVIHNAAAVRDHTIQNMTEDDWDHVLTVDLKAPYFLTKQLLPLLLRKNTEAAAGKARKIFMITSRVALQGGFGVSNYAAAKAGLIGLVKSLAQELGKRKILVNAVNPGFMPSRMTATLPEAVIARNLQASLLGEYSDPEEVADFLVYLASDQMNQVTGQVLHWEGRGI